MNKENINKLYYKLNREYFNKSKNVNLNEKLNLNLNELEYLKIILFELHNNKEIILKENDKK